MGDDRKFNLTMLNPEFAKLSYLTARVLESLDTNGDKELTLDEYRKLDTNMDRFLVRAELREIIGGMKACDGLCKIFAEDNNRIDEAISELSRIEFYEDVFITKFNTVEDLVAKRRVQGYRMTWYRVLDKDRSLTRADAARKFLGDLAALVDEYGRTSTISQKAKLDLLAVAADNYTDIFDTLVSFFRRLEEKDQDRDLLENVVFLLNHNLGFIGGNAKISLGPRNEQGKYRVSMIIQNAGL